MTRSTTTSQDAARRDAALEAPETPRPRRSLRLVLAVVAVAGMATAALFGWPHAKTWFAAKTDTAPGNSASAKPGGDAQLSPPPAITVARVTEAAFVAETVVTGTLVPRQEILVSPQIEGQQIAELLVDAGERVTEGQVLARLAGENIDAQLAQNSAAIARATAAIAQADSGIAQAAARLDEAEAQ